MRGARWSVQTTVTTAMVDKIAVTGRLRGRRRADTGRWVLIVVRGPRDGYYYSSRSYLAAAMKRNRIWRRRRRDAIRQKECLILLKFTSANETTVPNTLCYNTVNRSIRVNILENRRKKQYLKFLFYIITIYAVPHLIYAGPGCKQWFWALLPRQFIFKKIIA